MTAEIVDYLLIFWLLLAIVVYVVGNIYDAQLQAKRKKIRAKAAAHTSTNLDELAWTPSGGYDSVEAVNRSRYYGGQHQLGSTQQAATGSWSGHDSSNHYRRQSNYNDDLGHYSHVAGSSGYAANFDGDHNNQQQVRNRSSSYQLGGQFYYGEESRFNQPTPSATIPTATGFNADCIEWVNSIMYLFYSQPEKYGPIIGENVYRSLNEKLYNLTSSSSEHSQLLVEFTNLNSNESTKPELTNIRTDSESDKSISATCKIYNRRLSFALTVRRLTTPSGDESLRCYELIVENLEGKLKSMAMLNEKLIVIQFIEKPDMKISLRPTANANLSPYDGAGISSSGSSESQLINEDSLVQLILQSITQIVVDLYFGDDIDFPQYKHQSTAFSSYKHKLNNMLKGSASELKRQLKHDLFGALTSSSEQHKERKVFVKIVRATNINYNQDVTCLMELDNPRQQALSSTKRGSDPFWDEHFLFVINERSSELTLELWDSIDAVALSEHRTHMTESGSSSLRRNQKLKQQAKWHKSSLVAGAKFLGLARVSVEELRRNPVQKVNLALQSMGGLDASDLSNSVGGELQLELLFMEHSSSGGGGQPTAGNSQGAAMHKSNSASSLAYHQGDVVSIDRKLTPSGFVITTTTITKQPASNQQQQQQQQQQQMKSESLLTTRNQSPLGSASMATEHSFDELNFDGLSTSQLSTAAATAARMASSATAASTPDARSETIGAGSSTGGRLSRSRSRSRSFIRAIRKRFSFSRTRSRSVGESGAHQDGQQSPMDYEAHSRASSEVSAMEGGAETGQGGRAKSVPTSRDPSEVPTIVINKGRLSQDSAFTFAQPKSLLVYEVLEPGLSDGIVGEGRRRSSGATNERYRYYAVTNDNQANQRKWRKRGLKLHLFNEHQFVACHLAGSSTCHLCGRMFSRRPGKQGYKCRNCHLLSHKQCHVKVDHNCPYAKRNGLKLEYIDADPPAALLDEMAALGATRADSSGNVSPVSASIEMTHHYYQPQPRQQQRFAAPGDQQGSRQSSSQRGRQKPATLRLGTKSISVDVDDR